MLFVLVKGLSKIFTLYYHMLKFGTTKLAA